MASGWFQPLERVADDKWPFDWALWIWIIVTVAGACILIDVL